jgi:hypothetical protein
MLDIVQVFRQNHALEHATIHVLSRGNPHVKMVGRTTASGFVIYGPLDTQQVANAASEAIARLQQGEAHLAVHPRCGTNLAVTGLLCGTAAFASTLGRPRSKLDRLPIAVAAATLAALAAQPLAAIVQESVTTTSDVHNVAISDVARIERGTLVMHKVHLERE